jgi:hypothetical protein
MQHDDELPHELILSIQRVLETQSSDAFEPFNGDFNSINILNDFFPDGTLPVITAVLLADSSFRGFAGADRKCTGSSAADTTRVTSGTGWLERTTETKSGS